MKWPTQLVTKPGLVDEQGQVMSDFWISSQFVSISKAIAFAKTGHMGALFFQEFFQMETIVAVPNRLMRDARSRRQ